LISIGADAESLAPDGRVDVNGQWQLTFALPDGTAIGAQVNSASLAFFGVAGLSGCKVSDKIETRDLRAKIVAAARLLQAGVGATFEKRSFVLAGERTTGCAASDGKLFTVVSFESLLTSVVNSVEFTPSHPNGEICETSADRCAR